MKEESGKSHDFEWVLRETINSFIFRTALLSVRAFSSSIQYSLFIACLDKLGDNGQQLVPFLPRTRKLSTTLFGSRNRLQYSRK